MKIWNKWTWAIKSRQEWLALYGHRERNQEYVTKLNNLGENPTIDQIKEIFLTPGYGMHHLSLPRCDECGKQDNEQEVIELGAAIEIGGTSSDGSNRVNVCLPCVFKAFQMLDSSEIK